jgi:hypothetical protein
MLVTNAKYSEANNKHAVGAVVGKQRETKKRE